MKIFVYRGHNIIRHCYTGEGILSYGDLSINQLWERQEVQQNQGLGPALGPQESSAVPDLSILPAGLCVRLQLPPVSRALAPAGAATKARGTSLPLLGSLKQGPFTEHHCCLWALHCAPIPKIPGTWKNKQPLGMAKKLSSTHGQHLFFCLKATYWQGNAYVLRKGKDMRVQMPTRILSCAKEHLGWTLGGTFAQRRAKYIGMVCLGQWHSSLCGRSSRKEWMWHSLLCWGCHVGDGSPADLTGLSQTNWFCHSVTSQPLGQHGGWELSPACCRAQSTSSSWCTETARVCAEVAAQPTAAPWLATTPSGCWESTCSWCCSSPSAIPAVLRGTWPPWTSFSRRWRSRPWALRRPPCGSWWQRLCWT